MKYRLTVLLLATIAPLALASLIFFYPTTTAAIASTNDKLGPELQTALQNVQSADWIQVIVYLNKKTVLEKQALPQEEIPRRTAVIAQLQETAVSSQAPLRQQLENLQASGQVQKYQPLWIINAIVVTTTPETIADLAKSPSVAQITLDAEHSYFDPPTIFPKAKPTTSTVTGPTWGIQHIRVPWVWHGLGNDGSGVVVAIMDGGVDWKHPILRDNYRGQLLDGQVDHVGNWFSPGEPSLSEPSDSLGHGTHVAGIAVGKDGLGVAPGAKWIAVNIASNSGFILNSSIFRGFEWLLAPNDDPALAPDIINNSWAAPADADFYEEAVSVLQTAGILPIFSTGNNGPIEGSVGSPAGYDDVFSVGASDDIDEVAWFSSRGPSLFTDEPKPALVAPGTAVLSALPNNQYLLANGTSMAAPHVTGAAALILAANPQMPATEITQLLKETAVPIAESHPNNTSGWGRLDAYAAVASLTPTGDLSGQIIGGPGPLSAAVVTITTPANVKLSLQADTDGFFSAAVLPGTYQVEAAIFGYEPQTQNEIVVTTNAQIDIELPLTPLSSGTVEGQVLTMETNEPLAAQITVLDTPITTFTDENGRYELSLPVGTYTIRAQAPNHRIVEASVVIVESATSQQVFMLADGPSILLVDSGQWYYRSYIDYYKTSLYDIQHNFDLHVIRNPEIDVPTVEQLEAYDIVIWSAPLDSIGAVRANNIITDYLGTGGNLLISGEEVAARDGFGLGVQTWFYRDLDALFAGEASVEEQIQGTIGTPFSGMEFTLNGSGSADNQTAPDKTRLLNNGLTKPIFKYEGEGHAGLMSGHCRPFQLLYFGFGLEGMSNGQDRAELLERSITHFQEPFVDSGHTMLPEMIDNFAIPGESLTYTITIRNLSETITETFQLSLSESVWPTSLMTETVTIPPCETAETVVTIDVPPELGQDITHEMILTAVSPQDTLEITVRHKTPGNFLLVDDDRWYDQQSVFASALAENGIAFDVWETHDWPEGRGSPPLDILNQYKMVFWFTAYDWYAPITKEENETLAAYLAGNGRLFLNSQDYLYYNLNTPLTLTHFGIISQSESITPTYVYGDPLLGLDPELRQPLPLDYVDLQYQNFSDGLILAPHSKPFFWHNQGTPAGTINAGSNWRTVFLDIPLETLPDTAHAATMNSIIGWLSDLGDSTFEVDQPTASPQSTRTYTITLHNVGAITNSIRLTNSLPAGLTILPDTVASDAVYHSGSHQLTWQGNISQTRVITYRATVAPTAPTYLENRLTIVDEHLGIKFDKTAPLWLNAPNLRAAKVTATTTTDTIAYQLVVSNTGQAQTIPAHVYIRLPDAASPLTNTLSSNLGFAFLGNQTITWTLALEPNQAATVTLGLTHTAAADVWYPITAVIDDQTTAPIIRHLQLYLPARRHYLPFAARDKPT